MMANLNNRQVRMDAELPTWIRARLESAQTLAAYTPGILLDQKSCPSPEIKHAVEIVHVGTELSSHRDYALGMTLRSLGIEVQLKFTLADGSTPPWEVSDRLIRALGFEEKLYSPSYEVEGTGWDCEYTSYFKWNPS